MSVILNKLSKNNALGETDKEKKGSGAKGINVTRRKGGNN